MSAGVCVICQERIEDVSYIELHLVAGVASALYHEKCFVPSRTKELRRRVAELEAVEVAARDILTYEPQFDLHVVSGDYRKIKALASALADGGKPAGDG